MTKIQKKNITYIISNIEKAVAFEWVAEYLDKKKYNLNFILLNPDNTELEKHLTKNQFSVTRIRYRGKKDLLIAFIKTYQLLKKSKADIIHTHLFDANIIGLFAAWLGRIPKRIYTRHHSSYHHDYFPKAIKYDKFSNFLATDIVAISQKVKDVLHLKENVALSKIHLIHHGFDLNAFSETQEASIAHLKSKYQITKNNSPIIGVVARYVDFKGIQFIIPAIKNLTEQYPNSLLILAGTHGPIKDKIQQTLKNYLSPKNYLEIEFENDLFSLFKLFDIYIHVPINDQIEAFGQTYVEALAAGIPSIFTLSGIANEFIIDKHNALVVPYKNTDEIYTSIIKLLNDTALREKLISNGKKDVNSLFKLEKMISSLETLYDK